MRLITPQVYRHVGSKAAGLLSLETALTIPQFYVSNPSAASKGYREDPYCIYDDEYLMTNFNPGIEYFSVRSSSPLEDRPNTAMAGRFESRINVPREKVMDTVGQVRESMRDLHTKLGYPDLECPVIIQVMVWGYPGIVFTRGSVNNKYPDDLLKASPWLEHMTYEFYPKITKKTTVDEMGVGGKVEPEFASYIIEQSTYASVMFFNYLAFPGHLIHKDCEVMWLGKEKQQVEQSNQLVLLQCRSITA